MPASDCLRCRWPRAACSANRGCGRGSIQRPRSRKPMRRRMAVRNRGRACPVEDYLRRRQDRAAGHARARSAADRHVGRGDVGHPRHQAARASSIVSCDLATLARDVRRFADSGLQRSSHIEAFDLFPNTAHVRNIGGVVTDPPKGWTLPRIIRTGGISPTLLVSCL